MIACSSTPTSTVSYRTYVKPDTTPPTTVDPTLTVLSPLGVDPIELSEGRASLTYEQLDVRAAQLGLALARDRTQLRSLIAVVLRMEVADLAIWRANVARAEEIDAILDEASLAETSTP